MEKNKDKPRKSNVTFRGLRSQADYLAMLTVREKCIEWDAVDVLSPEERFPTHEELIESFPLPDADKVEQQLLLVEANREIIGYHTIHWWPHAAGMSYMHRGYLIPAWRQQGIGTKMLLWAEESIQAIARQHKGTKQYRAFLSVTAKEANRLLMHNGYIPSGGLTELCHDLQHLPQTTLPVGFRLKPPQPENYHQIWAANEEVFIAEPERSPPTEDSYRAFLNESDPSLWSVIWVGDQIAGVAFCEITQRGIGVISQLSVGNQWRRRGLGRVLVIDALHVLQKRDVQKVYVATDTDNLSALNLYQGVNFRYSKEFIHYRKPLLV